MATKGTVRDMITILQADGWVLNNTRGSHRQFVHPVKKGRVTVAGQPSKDMSIMNWNSALKQAGLR